VTYGALIEVDNLDLSLKPGMTASVRVRTGFAPNAFQVPNTALHFVPPGELQTETPHVWLIENGAIVNKAVHPSLSDGEQTEISMEELPLGTLVLVDLTQEGKLVYGLTTH
jgi:HlyD family secretion protein